MTGIVGYMQFKTANRNEALITKMTNSILLGKHQEIRDFSDDYLRLSVVTILGTNNYSYAVNEDETLKGLIYGYVYDFEKESERLKSRGHTFRTNGPAEFIVHAYEEYGKHVFEMLNGSFSIVIWNKKESKLMLVTDRFGTRPLYYAIKDGNIIFSSHARAILHYPDFPKKLNKYTLVKFLMFGKIGILGDDTWFDGIKLMPPASILEFTEKGIRLEKYWDLEYVSQLKEKNAVNMLVKAFRHAVNKRANVVNASACILLSGGLDSRSVLGALSDENRRKIVAVTFGVRDCDDIAIARKVTSKLGVKHIVLEYSPDELVKYAKYAVYLTDGQDTVNVSFLPYIAKKLMELDFKVYMQGYMFDLLLGGSFMPKGVFACKYMSELIALLYSKSTVFTPSELKRLLNQDLHDKIAVALREFVKLVEDSKGDCFANISDHFFIDSRVRRYTLMGSIINRHYVEELLPTIDNEVIEVIRRIPPNLRMNHKIYRKFLMTLSAAAAKIPYQKTLIPPIIPHPLWAFSYVLLYASKILRKVSKGRLSYEHTYFNFDEVLRKCPSWRSLIKDLLLNENSLIYKWGLLNKNYCTELVKEHFGGKNYGEKLAFLMTLELILRIFFDGQSLS